MSARIDAIAVYHLGLPLRQRLPGPAARYERFETVVVCVESGGLRGWSEVAPGNLPLQNCEWAESVFAILRDGMAVAALGASLDNSTAHENALSARLRPFRGNRHAKAALDMALWDLRARQQGKPLHVAIGGNATAIELSPVFDEMESPAALLNALTAVVDSGYNHVKLKLRPGWEVNMLQAVLREAPRPIYRVDIEGQLTLDNSGLLDRLDDFALAMIEQPLASDDLVGHSILQDRVRTPIALDESIRSPEMAEMALDLKSCRYMNLKPGRAGGMTATLAIHRLAQNNGIACWAGTSRPSSLGARFEWAVAALPNCVGPADYFPIHDYLAEDLAASLQPARKTLDGSPVIQLWDQPGIGVEPEQRVIERHALAVARLH